MRLGDFGVGSRPVEVARAGAAEYTRRNGMLVPRVENYNNVVVPQSVVGKVAASYGRLPAYDPAAVPAFKAMREEVGRQFDHLTAPRSKGGMGFEVGVTTHDPYGEPNEGGTKAFFKDVEQHKINVLSTATTGGHPIFSNDDNDMFRAVHDVFGHGGTGRGVDRHGEEAAYRKHATMFSPLAQQALAAETRGQNHAMIASGGQFQEQKVALLPPNLSRVSLTNGGAASERAKAMLQAQQFHRNQFG